MSFGDAVVTFTQVHLMAGSIFKWYVLKKSVKIHCASYSKNAFAQVGSTHL